MHPKTHQGWCLCPPILGKWQRVKSKLPKTPASREAALKLLTRARNSYLMRDAHQPWDLKVRLTVDSGGQTNHDGEWEMEDQFAPGQGLHWTAKSSTGYAISGIFAGKDTYTEATAGWIPLRLQEARAMLFNPLPSVAYARSGSIRTSTGSLHGSSVTCLLLSRSKSVTSPGRGWDEAEECIDPATGLLQMHSDVPGRYAVYDYSNGTPLNGHLLPHTITITEAGRVVSTITVESLQPISGVDPSLFVPTDAMKAAPATIMGSATRISRMQGPGPFTSSMTVRPVCVMGLLTPTGQLVEVHSLQPSDPNSDAAIKDAQGIDFSLTIHAGAPPQQHFVYVIENFVTGT